MAPGETNAPTFVVAVCKMTIETPQRCGGVAGCLLPGMVDVVGIGGRRAFGTPDAADQALSARNG